LEFLDNVPSYQLVIANLRNQFYAGIGDLLVGSTAVSSWPCLRLFIGWPIQNSVSVIMHNLAQHHNNLFELFSSGGLTLSDTHLPLESFRAAFEAHLKTSKEPTQPRYMDAKVRAAFFLEGQC
jgi:hypothetical protein